jgi:hypothetical protein
MAPCRAVSRHTRSALRGAARYCTADRHAHQARPVTLNLPPIGLHDLRHTHATLLPASIWCPRGDLNSQFPGGIGVHPVALKPVVQALPRNPYSQTTIRIHPVPRAAVSRELSRAQQLPYEVTKAMDSITGKWP